MAVPTGDELEAAAALDARVNQLAALADSRGVGELAQAPLRTLSAPPPILSVAWGVRPVQQGWGCSILSLCPLPFVARMMLKQVRLMVDAEQTYFQPAIDSIVYNLQRRFNGERTTIFSTYQCYLNDTEERLKNDLERADR